MTDDSGYPGEGWPKRDAALWYAGQGWRVGPLHTPDAHGACTCQHRAECRDIGKHPRTMNGLKDFSPDPEVVAGWWDIWPDANIGVATGRPFAFVVDEDEPGALDAGWHAALVHNAEATGSLPVAQRTPNGTHYLFDAGNDFGNSVGGRGRSLGPGIDTRGDGGYIIVAPSTTPSGAYAWRSDPRGPWPTLPEPMAEALRPAPLRAMDVRSNYSVGSGDDDRIERYVRAAVEAGAAEVCSAEDGTRNHVLNEVAFRLGTIGAHGVLDEPYALGAVAEAWDETWQHVTGPDGRPSQWDSFRKTWRSGWTAGTLRPREPWPPPALAEPDGDGLGFTPAGYVPADPVAWAAPLVWDEFLARDMTKAEWLAGELFERGQQVALVGAGKAGKSLLAFELARYIARGLPYLGAISHPQARVGYLDFENSQRDIQQRALAYGFTADDLEGLSYYSFPALPPLDTRAGGTALLSLVERDGTDVLFLDTVSRMIEGGENDSDTWLNLYRHSLMPLKARGIATVRLDHFGKDHDRGARGSSAKTQDVDHVWTLTRGEGGSLTLTRTHSRTGLGRDELRLIRHGEQAPDGWAPGQTRHVVSDIAFRPAEWLWRIEASKRLDEAGVPPDAGYDRCRTELARIGVQASTAKVKDLVKWRKSGGRET